MADSVNAHNRLRVRNLIRSPNNAEVVVTIGLLIAGFIALRNSAEIPLTNVADGDGPRMLPRIYSITIIAGVVIVLLQRLMVRNAGPDSTVDQVSANPIPIATEKTTNNEVFFETTNGSSHLGRLATIAQLPTYLPKRLMLMAAVTLYLIVMPMVGFVISTAAFTLVTMWLLQGTIKLVLGLPLPLALGIYWLFQGVLSVRLP